MKTIKAVLNFLWNDDLGLLLVIVVMFIGLGILVTEFLLQGN